MSDIWPNLSLQGGQPNQQILRGDGIQINTGLAQSTLTLTGIKSLDQHKNIRGAFEAWRDYLQLNQLLRLSARSTYVKEFASMREANAMLQNLKLGRWPQAKVFEQPMDSELNTIDMTFRFETVESFTTVRVKTDRLTFEADLDADFVDEPKIRKEKNRFVVDFDRGLLGTVDAAKLSIEDWLKGYTHVMRRDLDKVIGSNI
ncbi:MAG: hypothetical protein JWN23_2244 [Rhodocyclales bacterium]|nr:hypothetical protein [Rhodocyclales bacterium]